MSMRPFRSFQNSSQTLIERINLNDILAIGNFNDAIELNQRRIMAIGLKSDCCICSKCLETVAIQANQP